MRSKHIVHEAKERQINMNTQEVQERRHCKWSSPNLLIKLVKWMVDNSSTNGVPSVCARPMKEFPNAFIGSKDVNLENFSKDLVK